MGDVVMVFVPPAENPVRDREYNLARRLAHLFRLAQSKKKSRYDTWDRNYRILHNRITSPSAGNNWMPSPRDSEIYPILSSLVAWMVDQETNIDFAPVMDPHSTHADIITNLAQDLGDVVNSNWRIQHFDSQIKLMLWDAFLYSFGILKSVWDNDLDDGYGNASMLRIDPYRFFPDPNATSLADSEYMIEVSKMSADELERKFPDTAHKVLGEPSSVTTLEERPDVSDSTSQIAKTNPGNLGGANSTWSNPNSSGPSDLDTGTYIVYEFWLKENMDWTEEEDGELVKGVKSTWRVVVTCNDEILMDELAEDLFPHASHPYSRFVFDDVGDFYGISLVDHLAYPQMYINRLLTAAQFNTELTGNPIFMEGANSGLGRVSVINRPGQRLRLRGSTAMQNKPEWLTPPTMPAMVMDLVNFWISRLENTSGLSAIVKGATPMAQSRNSQGVMTSIQEAAFVRIRSALRNLEFTIEETAAKLADLIIDNYTEPRRMAILGEDGKKSAILLAARHFNVQEPGSPDSVPLKYVVVVDAGSATPTSRQSRIEESDRLFAMGAVDDQYVMEAHRVRNIPAILDRKYKKQQQGLFNPPGARQRSQRKS
jgi:hypothetical protein